MSVEPRCLPVVQDVIPSILNISNSLTDWVNLVGVLLDREYDVAISLEQNWFVGLLPG